MSELLALTLAAQRIMVFWFTLIGSGGAILFPDLVRSTGFFSDVYIDRGTVRLIAVPLFIACAVILTDHYYHWSEGLLT